MDKKPENRITNYKPTAWDALWKQIGINAFNKFQLEQLDVLMKENARYRKALEDIACYNDAENEQSLDEPYSAKIAREALKGEQNGTENGI